MNHTNPVCLVGRTGSGSLILDKRLLRSLLLFVFVGLFICIAGCARQDSSQASNQQASNKQNHDKHIQDDSAQSTTTKTTTTKNGNQPIDGNTTVIKHRVIIPKDCQEYFDALKQLAKENENFARKFGDKLAQVETSWQNLSDRRRQEFTKECILRNQQLKQLQGSDELQTLLNEL